MCKITDVKNRKLQLYGGTCCDMHIEVRQDGQQKSFHFLDFYISV